MAYAKLYIWYVRNAWC